MSRPRFVLQPCLDSANIHRNMLPSSRNFRVVAKEAFTKSSGCEYQESFNPLSNSAQLQQQYTTASSWAFAVLNRGAP